VFGQKISQLHTPTVACGRAKEILQEFHALGPSAQRIRGWDGYDVGYNPDTGRWWQRFGQALSDVHGRYLEYDIAWIVGGYKDPDHREVLAHEALHVYLNEIRSPMTFNEQHAWIATEAPKCAGTA